MKNKIAFYFTILLLSSVTKTGWFAHDRAALSAQKEDWHNAKMQLQQLVIEDPDNPQLLYDLGVAAYKLEEYLQAAEYAQEAAHKTSDSCLKERAYFNHGNSLVQLKKLQEAIDVYNQVLEINPQNEPALNNRERVKKMFEEERQKNQQQQQDRNRDQQQKDKQQDQQQNQSDSQNDQKKDEKSESQEDTQQHDQQLSNGQDDQEKAGDGSAQKESDSQERDEDQQGNSDKQKEQKEERKEGGRQEKSDQNNASQDDVRKDSSNKPEHEDGQDKMSEQDVDHTQPPQENKQQTSQEQNTQEPQKEQAGAVAQAHADTFKELDTRLARILEKQEEQDAQMSKKIIKMQVNKQLAGQNGQNRW